MCLDRRRLVMTSAEGIPRTASGIRTGADAAGPAPLVGASRRKPRLFGAESDVPSQVLDSVDRLSHVWLRRLVTIRLVQHPRLSHGRKSGQHQAAQTVASRLLGRCLQKASTETLGAVLGANKESADLANGRRERPHADAARRLSVISGQQQQAR